MHRTIQAGDDRRIYRFDPKLYGEESIKDCPRYVLADKGKDFAAFSFTSRRDDGAPITPTVRNFDIVVTGPGGGVVPHEGADIEEAALRCRLLAYVRTWGLYHQCEIGWPAYQKFSIYGKDRGRQGTSACEISIYSQRGKSGAPIKPKRVGGIPRGGERASRRSGVAFGVMR